MLVLLICFGGHFSEMFDRWEHTLQTGNDADYAAVVIAVVAGASLASIGVAFRLFSKSQCTDFRPALRAESLPPVLFVVVPLAPSPPLSLRI